MKRILSFLLAAALLGLGSSAEAQQKKQTSAKPQTSKTTSAKAKTGTQQTAAKKNVAKNKQEEAKPFWGVVYYELPDEPNSRGPKPVTTNYNPIRNNPWIDLPEGVEIDDSNNVVDHRKKQQDEDDYYGVPAAIFFSNNGTFAIIGMVGMVKMAEEEATNVVRSPSGQAVMSDPNSISAEDAELYKSIQYTRTDEQKDIIGYTTTKYEYRMGRYKGDIWVAEGLKTNYPSLPYVGMNHPVLEGDFWLLNDGELLAKTRILARKIRPEYEAAGTQNSLLNSQIVQASDVGALLRLMEGNR